MKPAPRTRVKICGITRIDDALAAANAGADAIGLVFWPGTPRKVEFEQARAIAAAVPAFVTIVGLFVDPQPAAVRAAVDAVPLDVLQFHGDEPQALCASFARPYIKAVPVRQDVPRIPPSLALQARGHGVLDLTIDERGRVVSLTIRQSVHPMYDTLLTTAAREWRYQPATLAGKPVKFRKLIQVNVTKTN